MPGGKGDWPGGTEANGKVEGGGVERFDGAGGGDFAWRGSYAGFPAWDCARLPPDGPAEPSPVPVDPMLFVDNPLNWAGKVGREGCGASSGDKELSTFEADGRTSPLDVRDDEAGPPSGEGPWGGVDELPSWWIDVIELFVECRLGV